MDVTPATTTGNYVEPGVCFVTYWSTESGSDMVSRETVGGGGGGGNRGLLGKRREEAQGGVGT